MKKLFLKLSLASLVLLSILSCNKNSSAKSKTEFLTQKAWTQSNIEVQSEGNWQTDLKFALSEACDKDDQVIFKTNKTFEVNEGASICGEAAPEDTEHGVWELIDNETKLTINGQTGTINQLDEGTLIVTFDLDIRLTLTH